MYDIACLVGADKHLTTHAYLELIIKIGNTISHIFYNVLLAHHFSSN